MADDVRRAEIEAVAAVILQGYERGGTAGGVAKRAIEALDRVRDARGECRCYGGLAFKDPMQHVPTCPARDARGDDETPSIGRMGTKPSEMGHQYEARPPQDEDHEAGIEAAAVALAEHCTQLWLGGNHAPAWHEVHEDVREEYRAVVRLILSRCRGLEA